MQRSSVGRLPFGGRVFRAWISALVLVGVSACGGGGSSSPTVLINPETPVTPVPPAKPVAPSIGTQPVSQSVQAGQTVTFSVTATGDAPLAYQWRRNGADVGGANAASYSFVAVAADNASSWIVKVSNAGGTAETAPVVLSVSVPPPPPVPVAALSMVAGSLGGEGNLDGVGGDARFLYLGALVADGPGNVYVLESGNSGIRRISSSGQVTHLANSAGLYPYALALDATGNLYAADNGHHVIRKFALDGSTAIIAGVLDQGGYADNRDPLAAKFLYPRGLAIDSAGNVYVADAGNDVVRKISTTGAVTTVQKMVRPTLLALDGAGNLYVGPEHRNDGLVKMTPDGKVSDSGIGHPDALSADKVGNIYVSASGDNVVRRISANGQIAQVTDWPLTHANLAFDAAGNVYSADTYSIGKYSPKGGLIEWAGKAGTGPALVSNQVIDSQGRLLVCGDQVFPQDTLQQLYRTSADGKLQPVAKVACQQLAIDRADNVYWVDTLIDDACDLIAGFSGRCRYWGALNRLSPDGTQTRITGSTGAANRPLNYADGPVSQALMDPIDALTSDGAGNMYFLAGGKVRKISSNLSLSTVADLPTLTVRSSQSLVVGPTGTLYFSNGYAVWKLLPSLAPVWLAGSQTELGAADGQGATARFSRITSLAVGADGSLYAADTDNHTVRKISTNGMVSTVAGRPGSWGNRLGDLPGSLDFPSGLVSDAQGQLYLHSGRAVLKLTLPK